MNIIDKFEWNKEYCDFVRWISKGEDCHMNPVWQGAFVKDL